MSNLSQNITHNLLSALFVERFVGTAGAALGAFSTLVAGVGVVSYFAPKFWSTGRVIYVRDEKSERSSI